MKGKRNDQPVEFSAGATEDADGFYVRFGLLNLDTKRMDEQFSVSTNSRAVMGSGDSEMQKIIESLANERPEWHDWLSQSWACLTLEDELVRDEIEDLIGNSPFMVITDTERDARLPVPGQSRLAGAVRVDESLRTYRQRTYGFDGEPIVEETTGSTIRGITVDHRDLTYLYEQLSDGAEHCTITDKQTGKILRETQPGENANNIGLLKDTIAALVAVEKEYGIE